MSSPVTTHTVEVYDPIRPTRSVTERSMVRLTMVAVPNTTVSMVAVAAAVNFNPTHRIPVKVHVHSDISPSLINADDRVPATGTGHPWPTVGATASEAVI